MFILIYHTLNKCYTFKIKYDNYNMDKVRLTKLIKKL